MIRIFLSYAREDYVAVKRLYERLKAEGYQPWMDKVDLLKGDDFTKAIPRVIRETDFFIVCLSTRSVVKRSFVQREIKLALELFQDKLESDLFIFPVRLDECGTPEGIGKFNWTDLFGDEADDEWEALLRALQEGVRRLGKTSTPQKIEPSRIVFSPPPSAIGETIEIARIPALSEKKSGGRKVTEMRRKALTERLATLEQQYFAANNQLITTLNAADKIPLRQRLVELEMEIEITEDELAALPPLVTPTAEIVEDKKKAAPHFQSFTEDLGNGIKLEMVAIPGGTFLMGSPESEVGRYDDEAPQHRVTVSEFYLGKYQVTQAQWQALMGNNPSYFKGENLPVEQVSWNEVQEFCQTLSQRTGKTYRLPTEAEWEYACRAGTTGAYAGTLDEMAWYLENSGSKTHPVGQKQPNAFGLYDMHGNVREWCQDWYGAYNQSSATDPQGPGSGSYRVNRGGGWSYPAAGCRSASRGRNSPGARGRVLGFRLVRQDR